MQRLRIPFKRQKQKKVERSTAGTADNNSSQEALKQTVEHVISECQKNKTTYKDNDFPNEANEKEDVLMKIYQWQRIGDINPRAADGRTKWSMFDDPQPLDVSPGSLDDSWIVAAMSAISDKPHILERIFVTKKYNKQGIYGLQLYVDGEWKYVIVDDRFPCNRHGELIFAWGKKMQLWVPLLEKAFAKLFGSYGALVKGNITVAMKFLMGFPLEIFSSHEHLTNKEDHKKAFTKITKSLEDNLLVSSITHDASPELEQVELKGNHLYTILDTTVIDTVQLLLLRNTWGSKIYRGNWGPKSLSWLGVSDLDELPSTSGDEEEGTFWIAIEEFAKYFRAFTICYVRENYHEHHVKARLPRAGDSVWEVFDVEVQEEACVDMNFTMHEGIVSDFEPMPMIASIYDKHQNLIGTTECDDIHTTVWKTKLLQPGSYRVYVLTFSQWNASQPLEYSMVVHSNRKVICQMICESTLQIPIHLMKLAVTFGTETYAKDSSYCTLEGDAWLGSVVIASNPNETDDIHCIIKKDVYENVLSTRILGNTYDIIPPGHSQVLQILTKENMKDKNMRTSHCVSIKLGRDVQCRAPNHHPSLAAKDLSLHGSFSTVELYKLGTAV